VHFSRHRTGADVEGQAFLNVRRELALQIDLRHRLFVFSNEKHVLVHPDELLGSRVHIFQLLLQSAKRQGATTGNAQCVATCKPRGCPGTPVDVDQAKENMR
jgi:hypothetical protein